MKEIEKVFLFTMVGLAIVEFLLNSVPTMGFFIYAIFVGVVLVMMENEVQHTKQEKVLIFLMILPVVRLAEIFFKFNFFWNTLLFYLLIIFLVMFYAMKFWYRVRKNQFIGNPVYLIIVLIIAGIAGLITKYGFESDSAGIIFLIPIIAYAEEIYFRGGFQNLTAEWFGNFSILFTSFLYAIFSIGYGLIFVMIAFIASLIISTVYHINKNIYTSFLLNIIFHIFLLIFYPAIF